LKSPARSRRPTLRLFVALEIDDAIHQHLAAAQRQLASQVDGVRWTKPEQIHLTLKFLGEAPESHLPEISQAAQQIAEGSSIFDFAVRHVGCFPPKGAVRIIWAGVEEPSGALAACQSACESTFERLGFARESRQFNPHLTIGRVKQGGGRGDMRQRVEEHQAFDAGLQPAKELTLFQSILSPRGPTYIALSRSALIGKK
jgi:2'-5' RNA ligase